MATAVTAAPRLAGPTRMSRLLPVTAAASLGLMIGGLVMSGLTGEIFPSPFEPAGVITDYFARHSQAVQRQSPFMLGSAAALAAYSALISARLRGSGRIAWSQLTLTAGTLGAAMLALSGLSTWVLARTGERSPADGLRAVHDLTFVTGGVCHILFLALMIASVALAGRSGGLLPRPMIAVGIVIGVLGVASLASLLVPALSILLPIVRFPGLIWMIVAGFLIRGSDRVASGA